MSGCDRRELWPRHHKTLASNLELGDVARATKVPRAVHSWATTRVDKDGAQDTKSPGPDTTTLLLRLFPFTRQQGRAVSSCQDHSTRPRTLDLEDRSRENRGDCATLGRLFFWTISVRAYLSRTERGNDACKRAPHLVDGCQRLQQGCVERRRDHRLPDIHDALEDRSADLYRVNTATREDERN